MIKQHTKEFGFGLVAAILLLCSLFSMAYCQSVHEPCTNPEATCLGSNMDSDHAFVLDILRDIPTAGDEHIDRWRIELLAPINARLTVGAGFQHEDRRLFVPLGNDLRRKSWGITLRARIYIGG